MMRIRRLVTAYKNIKHLTYYYHSQENNLFDNIRAADTTEPTAKKSRAGGASAKS